MQAMFLSIRRFHGTIATTTNERAACNAQSVIPITMVEPELHFDVQPDNTAWQFQVGPSTYIF